jgi:Fic family protein
VDSERIVALQKSYRQMFQKRKASPTALAIVDELFLNPYVTATRLAKRLNVSFPTVQTTIDWLLKIGILREITGRQRNRVYCAEELLRAIEGQPVAASRIRRVMRRK